MSTKSATAIARRQKLIAARGRTTIVTLMLEGEPETFEIRGLKSGAALALQRNATRKTRNADGEEVEEQDLTILTPALLTATVYDPESGEPIFGAADREAILELPMEFVQPLVEAANELGGMSKKALELAEKNSAPSPASASASPSPES
jgi:hypothetical protein